MYVGLLTEDESWVTGGCWKRGTQKQNPAGDLPGWTRLPGCRELRSESEDTGELDLTRAADGVGDDTNALTGEGGWVDAGADGREAIAARGDSVAVGAEVRIAAKAIARRVEAGCVGDVQDFHGETKIGLFGDPGLLHESDVGALLEGAAEDVTSAVGESGLEGIAEGAAVGGGSAGRYALRSACLDERVGERGWIEGRIVGPERSASAGQSLSLGDTGRERQDGVGEEIVGREVEAADGSAEIVDVVRLSALQNRVSVHTPAIGENTQSLDAGLVLGQGVAEADGNSVGLIEVG
jgi:hypothetical protein